MTSSCIKAKAVPHHWTKIIVWFVICGKINYCYETIQEDYKYLLEHNTPSHFHKDYDADTDHLSDVDEPEASSWDRKMSLQSIWKLPGKSW